jgi:hypothetical protein
VRSLARKLSLGVSAVALALTGIAITAAPAAADTPYSSISTVGANMCLDDPNGDTSNHVQIQIYTCNGGLNQHWNFIPSVSFPGYGFLENMASLKCLDVEAGSLADMATIQQYTCGTGTNQLWDYEPGPDLIRNYNSQKCLTVAGKSQHALTFQDTCGFYVYSWLENP